MQLQADRSYQLLKIFGIRSPKGQCDVITEVSVGGVTRDSGYVVGPPVTVTAAVTVGPPVTAAMMVGSLVAEAIMVWPL